jgi:hypothetical protein
MSPADRPDRAAPAPPAEPPGNAFTDAFLRRLRREDDLYEALEAELSGPWTVRPVGADGFGVFRHWESPELGDRPRAVFRDPGVALLAAAVLPALGREATYRLGTDPDELGLYPLERGGEAWGATPIFDEALLGALNLATELVRSPRSLALLLSAAGPTALELVGRQLDRETSAALTPPAPGGAPSPSARRASRRRA